MNTEDLVYSLTKEDLQAVLRCSGEDSSGSMDQLQRMVVGKFEKLPWKSLLICVSKESL